MAIMTFPNIIYIAFDITPNPFEALTAIAMVILLPILLSLLANEVLTNIKSQ